jgi:Uma2 family endonuclease
MSVLTLPPQANPPVPASSVPLMTADEFFARYENRRAELIRGVVKEVPMPGAQHGRICIRVGRFLDEFADKHDLGRVMSNDTFIKLRRDPDTVRGADVCFVSYDRLPRGPIPRGLLDVVPELVVEVRSPSDTWTDVIGKVLEYLAAGVTAVVVFNPDRQAVAVYRTADEEQFTIEQDLTIPDLLPGFAVPVRKLFE